MWGGFFIASSSSCDIVWNIIDGGKVWFNMIRCGMIWYDMMRWVVILYDMIWCIVIRHDVIWYQTQILLLSLLLFQLMCSQKTRLPLQLASYHSFHQAISSFNLHSFPPSSILFSCIITVSSIFHYLLPCTLLFLFLFFSLSLSISLFSLSFSLSLLRPLTLTFTFFLSLSPSFSLSLSLSLSLCFSSF